MAGASQCARGRTDGFYISYSYGRDFHGSEEERSISHRVDVRGYRLHAGSGACQHRLRGRFGDAFSASRLRRGLAVSL